MKMKRISAFLAAAAIALSIPMTVFASGSKRIITVSPENVSHEVSDMLYGAFIEDISYACDGGLVSNLVNNNSFEYDGMPDVYWTHEGGDFSVSGDAPMNENNPRCARLVCDGTMTLRNIGFPEIYKYKTWEIDPEKINRPDMGFKKDGKYELSLYLKNVDFNGTLSTYLDSEGNREKVTVETEFGDEWTFVSCELVSKETADGALALELNGSGTLLVDFVRLIPESSHGYGSDEWKYVTLRNDLYEALENWNPKFLRFPGGCLCEGTELDSLYSWKNTIGPVEMRRQEPNLWRDDNWHRHYINTNSMGYHEYFQLCKDISAEPVPILNVALTCQGRNGYGAEREKYRNGELSDEQWEAYLDTIALRPGTPEFDAYVQDIFDLIDYANGDGSTYWSAKRIENGQKEPFGLKYIGLGNENWGDVYFRNFDAIYNAVKEKHPEITVISSSGTWLDGEDFDYAWKTINEKYPDTVVDEHYYTEGGFLFTQNERYDSYDRNGAGAFIGEYAATSEGYGTIQTKANIWSAIEEAGYLTGLERNGDAVKMASYAPTFAKINAQSWTINMLWFDSQELLLSPDYFVQMLFSHNTGTRYIETELENGKTFVERDMYESVTVDEENQIIYVKIVNASGKRQTVGVAVPEYDVNRVSVVGLSELFKGAGNEAGKCYVTPFEKELSVKDRASGLINVPVGKYSVNVVRIAYGDGVDNAGKLYELPDNLPRDRGLYIPIAVKAAAGGSAALIAVAAVVTAIVVKKVKSRKIK